MRYRKGFQNSVWSGVPDALYDIQAQWVVFRADREKKCKAKQTVSVFILEKKKKITEINLFVAWHYHGQIMCLYLLFIVTDPHKICGCPLEKESWRASAIHFSSLELTCFLTEHSHFKCSLIKILLLISSLKTEPELIWHVFEGGKLGKKASVFSVNSRNGTN